MNKFLHIIVILSISSFAYTYSQAPLKLTSEKNAYQAGDSLYKYQVEYKDPGSRGRELEWDFSNLKIVNEEYLIKYFLPDRSDKSKLCGMEHRTRYYYRMQADSLWALGFENYTTLMNYNKPELKLKFPFTYGDTLYSAFTGKGIYCNMLPLHVKGYTRVEADAEGTIKLPDNKKVSKALRTHTLRYYTETGKDSVEMTLDTYSWYVKGIRYPIFESIKTTLHRLPPLSLGEGSGVRSNAVADTTVFHTSFYYSPDELKTLSDAEQNTKDTNGNPVSEAETVFTEARLLPNPVVNNLNIDFKLTRTAVIWFTVHNNIGVPMLQTTPQTLNKGQHYSTIPRNKLHTGTYTVYVHVDDMMVSRVVVKK